MTSLSAVDKDADVLSWWLYDVDWTSVNGLGMCLRYNLAHIRRILSRRSVFTFHRGNKNEGECASTKGALTHSSDSQHLSYSHLRLQACDGKFNVEP